MQMNNRYITVKGVGKVSAKPDQIVLLMTFEVVKAKYDEAMSGGAVTHSTIRSAVINAGHNEKALKTSDFYINTKYESYRDKDNNLKKRFEGYRYYHGVRLEFDYDLSVLSKTLNEIAKSRAVPHIEIKFTVKEPNNMSEKLLESAVKNAESNAKVLAKAAGVELGNILRIDYNWSDIHFYSDTDAMSVASPLMKAESFHEIEPDDIKVNDNATVIWEIK
jgi:hypothetical protein